jgi:HD-like signal output (HDOD) protein
MATFARALSTHVEGRRIDRDAMILGGMLSGVGKIYILAEMAAHEEVLNDFAATEHLLQTWHVKLTQAMLSNWDFPSSVVRAATASGDGKAPQSDDTVADLLHVAGMFADSNGDLEIVAPRLSMSGSAARLGLSQVKPDLILELARREAASFGGALT